LKPSLPLLETVFYHLLPSAFGPIVIVWKESDRCTVVIRVLLSNDQDSAPDRLRSAYPLARSKTCSEISGLAEEMDGFLRGRPHIFPLDSVRIEDCPGFQRKVLLAEYNIPRGKVSPYSRIAAQVGHPGAARAVGNALARNPFPILIPCHRAIRSDGRLGGFQGGVRMKRALLEMEGVSFSQQGRVLSGMLYDPE
jgi:methylated-DNA-[protein]-cysteine S-methyltransferase